MDKLYEIGKVSLNWLGQMGFLIETDNIRLCIDYFASPDDLRQTPVPIPTGELKDVDVFLGTHDHLDHIDHEAYAVCILYTERVSHDSDPVTIGIIQLGTMGLISLMASFFTGGLGMPQNGSQWTMMLILVLLCSCFGFAFQPLGQKYLQAENAAVLTVVNPLTASVLGILVADERLTVLKLVGYVIIMSALVIYNVNQKK